MSEVGIRQAASRRTTDEVLDIREDFEVADGMIPAALHIPRRQLNARLGEIDRGRPVIVIGRSGTSPARTREGTAPCPSPCS